MERNNKKINTNLKKNKSLQHHEQEKLKVELIEKHNISSHETDKSNKKIMHKKQDQKMKKKNVDNILENILPDYNKHISIEVNHVDLTFEVSSEKVDTIKESFIRTIQRKNPGKLKIHALKDISFKIYKGEKVGIIGFNGAGKSTLLSLITGIYPPDKGFVKTNGNISPLLSLGAGFDYNGTGRQNIFLNGAVLGYDKKFLESKENEIIEFSELGEFIDIPIKNYSSGMLAKLGFSIATAVNPDILIIDEVLGVGDVNFFKKSRDKIKSLMDGGTTVLLVSHSIPQIRDLCDKAIWINEGSLKEIGDVNTICDHYLKDAEKASNEQLANIEFR
ncbi:ABC transporter ATP-binding protein [uncultured Methanobrevibacter sp.]|uniref:ABC transporter ATP-binding protein n=1 Tax=uncultured Methanobrevibacter sp. TaxID=253161 RepID=UPI0025FF30E8|nr:ABC transporter ATP-binding protein [uncultured Methanobrevibacter sp.]